LLPKPQKPQKCPELINLLNNNHHCCWSSGSFLKQFTVYIN